MTDLEAIKGLFPAGYFRGQLKLRPYFYEYARALHEMYSPSSVISVGCGCAHELEWWRLIDRKKRRLVGLDGAASNIREVVDRQTAALISEFTVENWNPLQWPPFDLLVSFEFAEHMDPDLTDTFVEKACLSSDILLVTAATPGQGGRGHYNEHPHSFWIDRFEAAGYAHCPEKTKEWKGRIQPFCLKHRTNRVKNAMIFTSRTDSLNERRAKWTPDSQS